LLAGFLFVILPRDGHRTLDGGRQLLLPFQSNLGVLASDAEVEVVGDL
jgi:hypothetical protein